MKLRPATEEEVGRWDELVAANPDGGHFLQSKVWGQFKGRHRWEPKLFVLEPDDVVVLVLARRAPIGEILYVPKGPGISDPKKLKDFIAAIKEAHPPAISVRIEPELAQDSVEPKQLGLIRARQQVLKATIKVDLRPDEEQILAGFKSKTRYNVRLAGRHGVKVEAVPADAANRRIMLDLMKTTQGRAGYFLHRPKYFEDYWQAFSEAGQGQLLLAKHEGEVLAGIFLIKFGNKVWYKDGGSVRKKSEVMAPYALQWEAMRWAKAQGATSYDMWGVAPRGEEGHIMSSLDQFKQGFNEEITEFIGTWDIVLKPGAYRRWSRAGERLAVALSARVRREYWY